MRPALATFIPIVVTLFLAPTRAEEPAVVGEQGANRVVVPTNQVLTPAGRLVTFPGRPVDLALLGDGKTVAIKNLRDLVLLDVTTATILQTLRLPSGGHAVSGLAVADSGKAIYTSATGGKIHVARRASGQEPYRWADSFTLPTQPVGGDPAPTGLALDDDGKTLLVLTGLGNSLLRLDAQSGRPIGEPIAVGVAPFGVVVARGGKAYVSNWAGSPPTNDEPQAPSSKTPVKIDPRTGAAASGSVSVVDLRAGKEVKTVATGLHPSGLALSADGEFLYIACANSDTVDVLATKNDTVVETIAVRPEARLPFGSGPNALAVSLDGDRLYVANGTNNAVAVVDLGSKASATLRADGPSRTAGFIPVGWYPGAVAVLPLGWVSLRGPLPSAREELIVANIKGQGSRRPRVEDRFNSHDHLGSISIVLAPDAGRLEDYTRQVARNNRQTLAVAGLEPPRAGALPRPVPERYGEPSPIKHVVYIIKENRTYDQILGDLPRGNGDPSLVMFGREVTPNQHALAEEFVLLDNFYCSGVLSADGHAWATEAYATDYLERHFGGFVRSYPYDGDDPLAYASSGFLWDNALAHGRTFRDYGEFVKARISPPEAKWADLYTDYRSGTTRVKVEARPGVETLREHLCPSYVGFPGTVPDVYRAREFLKEFRAFEARGALPDLIVMLLPNDHTSGTRPDLPTPRATVADNDLALGRIVEAITHSRFWPETAIFVVEDDPQAGLDHVDGHRTVAQVISPYTRRGSVDHNFYSQVGMVKTIELILGLPPMNQMDLAAPAMRSCFQDRPDSRPFVARPNQVPLDEMNPPLTALSGPRLFWARKSLDLPLDDIDEADEDTLNQILWYATKGYDVAYPKVARAENDDD
jgi:DNA-binding beta-propeller fold protein YncE